MSLLRSICIALTLTAPLAHAGVLIEPFAGYQMNRLQQSGTSDVKYNAVNYGARAGYQKQGLMVGAEYATGQGTDSSTTPSAKMTMTNLGAFVGYEFPVLLRLYAVYSFDAKLNQKIGTSQYKYDGGNAVKLGLGLTTLPFVALNLEYIKATYTKVDGVKMGKDLTAGTYGLSLSVPFSF